MSEDWYRNSDWNEEIEKAFFEKLGRARSQKDQYVVIQALSLTETFPEVTLRLVDLYFDSRKDDFDDVRAFLAKTRALLRLEKHDDAMAAYRAVLNREDEFPTLQTCAYVDYPYLVATQKIESEYENALQALDKYFGRLRFPLDCYKWYAAKALIENDGDSAAKALKAANLEKSDFKNNQNLGLVGQEHAGTIERLQKLCT